MQKFKINISLHALYRYMERVVGFDFTEMKLDYAMAHGLPSVRHVDDAKVIKWSIDNGVDFADIQGTLKGRIHNLMTAAQKKIFLNNNNKFYEKIVDPENKITYVMRENTLVTILN